MSKHYKYIPLGDKITFDIKSTSDPNLQLWQELTFLRHKRDSIYGKVVTAPYIDQAKTYYLDARRCNWKSAGLLYYYSFLNLAKAFLVKERAVSGKKLKSTSLYHGLHADPQSPSELIDFKVTIYPPESGKNHNVFSTYYESLIGAKWPFLKSVTIKLRSIIAYGDEMSYELDSLYKCGFSLIDCLSLIREQNDQIWFEFLVPDSSVEIISSENSAHISVVSKFEDLDDNDKATWFTAYGKANSDLTHHCLIRLTKTPITNENRSERLGSLRESLVRIFKNKILPLSSVDANDFFYWRYIPKVEMNEKKIFWHPMLSHYLFSFVLSTVLRYHPHIFHSDNKNSFLANAWCNQAAITTLRYFVMEFTKPAIRLN